MPVAEVTIVGAGPVGLTLAVLLGMRGRRVRVLERHVASLDRPRAVHLDHHGARILACAGVMAALAPKTEAMDAYEWRNAAGDVLLRLEPGDGLERWGWPESSMFAQPDLERALEDRLSGLPTVTLDRGCQVRRLDDVEGWVIGCDGAASTVRQLSGIAMEDLGYGHDWVIADVLPHRPVRWSPLNVQVCDPVRPTTLVSGGPGRRRYELMVLPGEDAEALATVEGCWGLLGPWAVTPANAELERTAGYRFEARIAESWRRGRVLLAGDAAHQMPPFAGQGLCAGLRDAANLAWKLDLVCTGRAGAALLDTYESERASQVRTEITFSIDLGRIICVIDEDEAAARDEAMTAGYRASGPTEPPPPPPVGPGLLADEDESAGTLAINAATPSGERLDAVRAGGWLLAGRRRNPAVDLTGEEAELFAELGGRCSGPVGGTPVLDRWWEELGADTVLIRPDGAVYGTAAGGVTLLGRLRVALERLGQVPQ